MDDNCDPNNMAKTDEEKAESLTTFFSGVFTKELDGMWELSNKPEIKTELNLDISKDAILKKLNKIKYLNHLVLTLSTPVFSGN